MNINFLKTESSSLGEFRWACGRIDSVGINIIKEPEFVQINSKGPEVYAKNPEEAILKMTEIVDIENGVENETETENDSGDWWKHV